MGWFDRWRRGTPVSEPIDYRKVSPSQWPSTSRARGVRDEDVALIGDETKVNPFTLPPVPEWAGPRKAAMAMDAVPAGDGVTISQLYAWATSGALGEGIGFLGYPYLAELTQRPEYRRISSIWAAECVRKWIEFKSDDDRTKRVEKALETMKVRDVIRQAIQLDGFFGRAQIFPDLGYEDEPEQLNAPFVPKAKVGVGTLKGFTVVEPFWSYPGEYQSTNPLASDFYVPKRWYIMGKIVHHSWLITIVGNPMPDMLKPAYAFGGLSMSQMAKPYVDNWLRTRQSVSDMIHSFSVMVLKTNMSTILSGAVGAIGSLLTRIKMFNRTRDNRGLMAIDKETEELENISMPLGTLDKLQAQAQEQMSSITGIPLVVLLGVTPSGLNASSDGELRTFYATIDGYLERVIRHPLQFIIDLVQLHVDGTINPDLKWDFIPLWETPETEKAQMRKADAETDVAYVGAGVINNEDVRKRITSDPESIYYGMDLEEPADDPSLDDPLGEHDDGDDLLPGLKLPGVGGEQGQ